MAKLIDWLSVKYGVLFVISAGNHAKTIALEIPRATFNQSQRTDIESATVKALYQNARGILNCFLPPKVLMGSLWDLLI
jgi:hypothetical protein